MVPALVSVSAAPVERGRLPEFALLLVAGTLGLALASLTVVALAVLAAVTVPRHISRTRQRARHEKSLAELPNVVDLLIAEVRSGVSLREALAVLGTTNKFEQGRTLLTPLTNAIDVGLPLDQAINTLRTSPEPSVRLVGIGLEVISTSGGPAAQALQHLRHTLMGSVHGRQEVRVQAAQARASASLLSLAPVAFAVLASLADRGVARFYLFDWRGTACVVVSVLLAGSGWRWMLSMVDKSGRLL